MFKVHIVGSELHSFRRLLNALTDANLLSPCIVWEDLPDRCILEVEGYSETAKVFVKNGFRIDSDRLDPETGEVK